MDKFIELSKIREVNSQLVRTDKKEIAIRLKNQVEYGTVRNILNAKYNLTATPIRLKVLNTAQEIILERKRSLANMQTK